MCDEMTSGGLDVAFRAMMADPALQDPRLKRDVLMYFAELLIGLADEVQALAEVIDSGIACACATCQKLREEESADGGC